MSKTWFPMVDLTRCNTCLACVELCEYDVFEEFGKDSQYVNVANRDNCIDGCKECAKFCLAKAIVFPDEIEDMVKMGYLKCGCGGHVLKEK